MQFRQNSSLLERTSRTHIIYSVSRKLVSCLQLTVLICILFLTCAPRAMAERRVALVIGNGTYENLKPLHNPVNDAGDIASALKALGFEVMQGINLNQAAM